MTKNTSIEVMAKIVDLLQPLETEERMRIIHAALTLLGDALVQNSVGSKLGHHESGSNADSIFPSRAHAWMKQYSISPENIQQVFHLVDGTAQVIASRIPGKKKEQTLNVYILAGIAQLLATGDPTFDDKTARSLC